MVPPKLLYDRAAGSPKLFYAVAQASDGRGVLWAQLVAHLIDHSKNSHRYGPGDFTLHDDSALTVRLSSRRSLSQRPPPARAKRPNPPPIAKHALSVAEVSSSVTIGNANA